MKISKEGRKKAVMGGRMLRSSIKGILVRFVMFLVTYVSCLVTPIIFCIEQNVSMTSGISIFLMLCDICFAFDFYVWYKQNRGHFRVKKIQKIPKGVVYDGVLRFVGFSSLYLVPLASISGVNGRDLAWLTIFRLVSDFIFTNACLPAQTKSNFVISIPLF